MAAENETAPPAPAIRQPEKTGPFAYVDFISVDAAKRNDKGRHSVSVNNFRSLGECSEREFFAIRLIGEARTEGCLILDQSTPERLVVRWATSEVSTYNATEWSIKLHHEFPKPGCEQDHLYFVQSPDTSPLHAALKKRIESEPGLLLTNPIVKLSINSLGVIENATIEKSSTDAGSDKIVVLWSYSVRFAPDPCEDRLGRFAFLPVNVSHILEE